jgi:hypothetical protein
MGAEQLRPGAKEIWPPFEPLALTGRQSFSSRARTAEAQLRASEKKACCCSPSANTRGTSPRIEPRIEMGYGKITPPSANDVAK